MKKRRLYYGWILMAAVALAALFGIFAINSSGEPSLRGAVFLTIGLDQTALETEVSSYEIHRATEHFSNIILGWTVEPAFNDEFMAALEGRSYLGTYTGRLQEKQNMLFIFTEDDREAMELFVSVIEQRIAEYNAATHAGYVIALERHSTLPAADSDLRVLLGIIVLALGFTVVSLMAWEYVLTNRR